MTSLTQIAVPFHNHELIVVEYNNQPYTAMRPIVEGIGLDWKAQLVKIKQRFASVVGEITTTGKDGKQYQMLCLPLKKLFGWLMTISPNKVKPELRDTVIMYQNECDDVLWDYWMKGQTINPRFKTHKSEREPLTNAVNMLIAKSKHLNYSDAYKLVHQRFNVEHIEDIPYDAIPVAVEYVHHLIALFSHQQRKANDMNTIALAHCMIWCRQWWKEYGEAIRKINPNIAAAVHDHFIDGAFVAWMFVAESEKASLRKKLDSYQWNLSSNERLRLI